MLFLLSIGGKENGPLRITFIGLELYGLRTKS